MEKLIKKTEYKPFNTFVFRTPLISFQEYSENMRRLDTNPEYWKEFLSDTLLQEAIFLGTPVLYEEILKYLDGKLSVQKEINKLKMSVIRYYSRMSTRCTPFGLFAGFSLGKLGDKDSILLEDEENYRRYTRLDMNYLCNLAQDFGKMPVIKESLKYYPNSSLYQLGDRYRYVEYFYRNAKRVHHITSVEYSEYLENIFNKASGGASIEDLAKTLVDEEINIEEATEFIHELIDNQLLVSGLDPAITGKDFLLQLSNIIENVEVEQVFKEKIKTLSMLLTNLDKTPLGKSLDYYKEIENIVQELKTGYEAKFLFQTDMFKPIKESELNRKWINEIKEGLTLMNKLSLKPNETLMGKFAQNYYERYEDKEMPLLQVLDTESGIGYQEGSGDLNPLLDGYVFPQRMAESNSLSWNRIQSVLHKKLMDAYKNNDFTVEIKEDDFKFLETNWEDLPPSISNMCQFFSVDEEEPLIFVHGSGGSSAANLLGRFCHVEEELEKFVKEITNYEQSINEEVIYAEIVHLPESRIGNILLRPVLRSYEIPYLAQSSVSEEFQLPLSDLYVSVRGNTVFLRSKKLNKIIVPRMSTAHNFSFNAMPVYHFLCDLQTQGLRGGIGFHWGSLANEYEFLPRVKYKNVILFLAKWTLKTEELKKIMEGDNDENIMKNLSIWKEEKKFPRYMVLPDGDNELFVDFDSLLSIQALYSVIKKRPNFQLEEFPFDSNHALVKNSEGNSYTNEFVFGFYKTTKDE